MNSDKIQIFQGQLDLPFGTSCIISSCWETVTEIHCESIAIIFALDGKIDLTAIYHPLLKDNGRIETIEDGINYGYKMALTFLPKLIWDFICRNSLGIRQIPNANNIECLLLEFQDAELIILSQMKTMDSSILDWLEENVKSDLLKSLIVTAKKMDIQVSEYHQK